MSYVSIIEDKIMPKYVVHPGPVFCDDGDMHHISFHRLCELYRVSPKDCVKAPQTEDELRGHRGFPEGVIHLYPSSSGNYTFEKYNEQR